MTLTQYFRLVDMQARLALKADAAKFFLGYIWWVLEPLLFVGVFYVVFNVILDSNRADFLVFLMCGKLPFVWFSKSVNSSANAIVGNAGLIGKIDIPKTMFPMVRIQEGLYRQIAVFALLFAVLMAYDYPVTLNWLWVVPIACVQYLMIIACSFIGATLVCFLRDFSLVITLGMIFLMFTSGIFWDPRTLADPAMTDIILTWNPVAFVLDAYRQALMFDQGPDLVLLLANACVFASLIFIMARLMRKGSQRLALEALS
jgi:lipopolysaccharide transport system permease protein